MSVLAVIPARYASTRFPAKPLVDIAGKSMIRRVYEQVKQCSAVQDVIVATDHKLIYDHVIAFGGKVIMTKEEHPSGTDRCYEVLQKAGGNYDFVVNVQGDEPFIKPEQITQLVSVLTKNTELATLVKKIEDEETLFNVNVPKVILNEKGEALYFSRQTIPFIRGKEKNTWLKEHTFYKHIGIYAYRSDILAKITALAPSALEKAESLEQLRWLENGYKIQTAVTTFENIGIDTPEDLAKALKDVQI